MVISFNQNAYVVNEGDDLTVSVVANRIFENGPFQVTVRSQDGTAIGMCTTLKNAAL